MEISGTFEERHGKLAAGKGDYAGANPEDQDEPSGARQSAMMNLAMHVCAPAP